MTGIDYSCYDIPRTPKVWTSWLEINYNSFKLETWNGNAYKLETSQSPKYSERKYCLLPFSFDGVGSTCAKWWYGDDDNPRVHCENVAMSLKNCAIRAVFRRRPPQALLVVKIDLSMLCSAWPGAALAAAKKRHQLTHQCSINYTRSLKRESISAQSLLSNSFRKILRASDIDAQNEWWMMKLIRGKTVISLEKEEQKIVFF